LSATCGRALLDYRFKISVAYCFCHSLPTQEADKNKDGKISYAEFLATFREQTHAVVQTVEGAEPIAVSTLNNESLVGLDAKIPGGIYDSSLV
jgi:hypothetical protein